MKKIIIPTLCFLILFTTLSFNTISSIDEGKYFCIYGYNHTTKKIVISNVFYESEFESGMGTLNTVTVAKYIENELDFDLKSYSNIIIYTNEGKNYVYDDRIDAIKKAKDDGYSVLKFKVKSEKGKLYELD